MKNIFLQLFVSIIVLSCASNKSLVGNNSIRYNVVKSVKHSTAKNSILTNNFIDDTSFVNLKDYSKDFVYDMRYATTNNFLKTKVYDCPECYLRLKTVKALIKANNAFLKKGYRIKLYDCYRPLDIQKKMWEIVSNPEYVANPAKGSIHNRGGAVDISLVDNQGNELDMGTTFDFFGKEASHNYLNFSTNILSNRILLKTVMIDNNFTIFDSEWWHYSYKDAGKDKLSNFKWNCD